MCECIKSTVSQNSIFLVVLIYALVMVVAFIQVSQTVVKLMKSENLMEHRLDRLCLVFETNIIKQEYLNNKWLLICKLTPSNFHSFLKV